MDKKIVLEECIFVVEFVAELVAYVHKTATKARMATKVLVLFYTPTKPVKV